MKYGSYEIRNYHPNFLFQIANLQRNLWSRDIDKNISYFKWKYIDNPFIENPVGIVALFKGKVVGFRGFFVTKWKYCDRYNNILILSPADLCVHIEHRREGLFTMMTKVALKEYEDTNYKIALNFSSNEYSTPGYLKMGWIKIANKTYMKKYSLVGLLNYILIKKAKLRVLNSNISFGRFGNIEISNQPKAKEMLLVIKKQKNLNNRIKLHKDINFFNWRFRYSKSKYIFYYYWENKNIKGYLIVKKSENNNNGIIIDYEQIEDISFREILRYILINKHYDVLSILNINLKNELIRILKSLYFNELISRVKIGFQYKNHPILVRPIKREYTSEDYLIYGVDIRNVENWEFKGICTDDI